MARKPSGADPERVYQAFLRHGGNASAAARECKIPPWKAQDWRHRYGWDARFVEDTRAVIGDAVDAAKASLSLGLSGAIAVCTSLMHDDTVPPKDRIFAARTLLGYAAQLQAGPSNRLNLTLVDARKVEDARKLPPSELFSAAANILDANIADATESRRRLGQPNKV